MYPIDIKERVMNAICTTEYQEITDI